MRIWRNWQTRQIQVLIAARLCRFKSCYPHQFKGLITYCYKAFTFLFTTCQDLSRLSAKPIWVVAVTAKRSERRQVLLSAPNQKNPNKIFPTTKWFRFFCFFCMIIPTAEGYDFSFKVRNFSPFVVNFCFSSYVMPIL